MLLKLIHCIAAIMCRTDNYKGALIAFRNLRGKYTTK